MKLRSKTITEGVSKSKTLRNVTAKKVKISDKKQKFPLNLCETLSSNVNSVPIDEVFKRCSTSYFGLGAKDRETHAMEKLLYRAKLCIVNQDFQNLVTIIKICSRYAHARLYSSTLEKYMCLLITRDNMVKKQHIYEQYFQMCAAKTPNINDVMRNIFNTPNANGSNNNKQIT